MLYRPNADWVALKSVCMPTGMTQKQLALEYLLRLLFGEVKKIPDINWSAVVKKLFFMVTAFIGGFCIMGLELCGFRIFSPVFGYSIYVSGSLIGIIMVALSAGYIIGGKLADKYKSQTLLYRLILAAGIYCFVMIYTYHPILNLLFRTVAVSWGTLAAILIATIIIYGPSMFLLSMISPYIIGLLAHEENIGTTAGNIYGVSTIGSIFGTFLASFVLISAFGSHWTLVLFSTLVVIIGVLGLIGSSRLVLIALIPVIVLPFSAPVLPDNVLLHTESFYNDIRVIESASRIDPEKSVKQIQVNWWTAYSTTLTEGSVLTMGYYDLMSMAPLLTNADSMLILGMGAGTSVLQYQKLFPEIAIDAVEIDPEIVRLAEQYFNVQETDTVKIFAQDARPFLMRTDKKYDIVQLDLFQGGPYIPFYVASVEFYELIKSRMHDNSVVTMNILEFSPDRQLSSSLIKTMQQVFPSVFVVPVFNRMNYVAFAFNHKLSLTEAKNLLVDKELDYPYLKEVIGFTRQHMTIVTPPRYAQVFTDDTSNIEHITFRMIENIVKRIKRK